jgi:hypothetical protein
MEKIMYMYLETWFWICSFKYILEIQFIICRFGKHWKLYACDFGNVIMVMVCSKLWTLSTMQFNEH